MEPSNTYATNGSREVGFNDFISRVFFGLFQQDWFCTFIFALPFVYDDDVYG